MISEGEASKKLSKNESIKEDSHFLRGTILEGLADSSTGAISADDAQLTKFHGTYLQDDRDLRRELLKQKQEKAFSFMIRVRVPGGVCTPNQWIA
ncbi:MAG: sulfite reductase, partial [Opitutales bacterium]|nr:sulfite reductase [Opitutales bacterium]